MTDLKSTTASASLENLLATLEELKRRFEISDGSRIEKLLRSIGRKRFSDADSLVRFHEALLFIEAHPHNPRVLRLANELLASIAERVEGLRSVGADLYSLDYIENSGLSGTSVSGTFSYDIVCWLVKRYTARVDIDWDRYEKPERMGSTLPRFVPLLEEDSLAEANIPYQIWLAAASGRKKGTLAWLIRRIRNLQCSERERAEIYDSLVLPVRWNIGHIPVSRTLLKSRVHRIFYHKVPLIRRSDVSLASEFAAPAIPVTKLSEREGGKILDMTREATTVRYRELYGITHGSASNVTKAEVGRGVVIFLWGLPAERRLPLRGYTAGLTLKNGVPINYIEAITLFERTEVGFNTFYTYREGESAWVYAQALKLLNQLLGVTCISVDPYQLGFNNEEAIESGAFWFYRKLGFRPTRSAVRKLVQAEERKLGAQTGYRTPTRMLQRLAQGNMVYEVAETGSDYWDRFRVRNLGLRVQRLMARSFGGDAEAMRDNCRTMVGSWLGIDPSRWNRLEQAAFGNLALVLSLVPDRASWEEAEKRGIVRIVRAKAAPDEMQYILQLQRHKRLRDAICGLGSGDDASVGDNEGGGEWKV